MYSITQNQNINDELLFAFLFCFSIFFTFLIIFALSLKNIYFFCLLCANYTDIKLINNLVVLKWMKKWMKVN